MVVSIASVLNNIPYHLSFLNDMYPAIGFVVSHGSPFAAIASGHTTAGFSCSVLANVERSDLSAPFNCSNSPAMIKRIGALLTAPCDEILETTAETTFEYRLI